MAMLGNIPRGKTKDRSRSNNRITVAEETLDNNALSRRDLSARHDETSGPFSHSTSPVDMERRNKFHRRDHLHYQNNIDQHNDQ